MNTQVKYIKPFSNGQITIPKEFRKAYGINNDSWLKMTAEKGKIILEPAEKEKKMTKDEWRKWVLSFKGTWDLRDEIKQVRDEMEQKITSREL